MTHEMTVVIHNRGELDAEDHEVCRECWEPWPCPSVKADPLSPALAARDYIDAMKGITFAQKTRLKDYIDRIEETA